MNLVIFNGAPGSCSRHRRVSRNLSPGWGPRIASLGYFTGDSGRNLGFVATDALHIVQDRANELS